MGQISAKGKYDRKLKRAISEANQCKCIICGENNKMFSHTVPQFVLRKITNSNKNYKSSYNIEIPDFEPERIGISKAGVFQLICGTCDDKIFKTYETEKNYNSSDKEQEILREIALKNAFKKQYDILVALNLLIEEKNESEEIKKTIDYYTDLLKANDKEIQRIWDKFINNGKYKIVYKQVLNYKVPVVAQGHFPYMKGLLMSNKNGIMLAEEDGIWMNLAILIIDEKSIIFLFTDENYNKYDKWAEDFSTKQQEEKLKIINNMIFEELEDYFLDSTTDINEFQMDRDNIYSLERFHGRSVETKNWLSKENSII